MRLPFFAALCVVLTLALGADAMAQATPPAQKLTINVDRANLRDQPTTAGSTILTTLVKGTELEVIETCGTWYLVRVVTTGRVGFVSNTVTAVVSTAPPPTPATPRPTPTAPVTPPATTRPSAQPATELPDVALPDPDPVPPAPHTSSAPRVRRFRVFGTAGNASMSASKSFTAVLGRGTMRQFGGGVEVTDVWRAVFVRAAYARSSGTGSRVFVDDSGTAHSMNIPVTVVIAPLEISAGWRFGERPVGPLNVTPYLGASWVMQQYRETSSLGSADENVDITDQGQAAFGGVEIRLPRLRYARLGLEAQYRSVAGALGTGGVSQVFGDTSLGGVILRLNVGIGF